MSTPKPGWTIEAALQLLADGYSAEQVERMTGFNARHVEAQASVVAKAQLRAQAGEPVRPPQRVVPPKPTA
jgi:hypothetical protein